MKKSPISNVDSNVVVFYRSASSGKPANGSRWAVLSTNERRENKHQAPPTFVRFHNKPLTSEAQAAHSLLEGHMCSTHTEILLTFSSEISSVLPFLLLGQSSRLICSCSCAGSAGVCAPVTHSSILQLLRVRRGKHCEPSFNVFSLLQSAQFSLGQLVMKGV